MSLYTISPHAQHSPGWYADRLGKLTGSVADQIYTGGKGKTRAALRARLVLERMTGESGKAPFETEAMRWGTDQEPFSRMAFERETGFNVTQAGFIYRNRLATGCSVDGLLEEGGTLGIWESKSPDSETHYGWVLAGVLPEEHRHQVLHNMWVTNAQFGYFTSYDPRMPGNLKLFVVRVERDQDEILSHEAAVMQFLLETDQEEKLMRLKASEPLVFH